MFKADASITHEGKTYTLTLDEQKACQSGGDWHAPGDPSTWLSVSVFQAAKTKCSDRAIALALAAQALGISVEQLRSAIEWHVNYMRWHDGDYSYDV